MANIVGLKTKDGINMNVLKVDNNAIKIFDSTSGQYVPSVSQGTGTTIVQKKIYPSFTFPIPFDKNDDTLTLIVDISETPQFNNQRSYSQSSSSDMSDSSYTSNSSDSSQEEDYYVRINMANFKSKMRIISNGKFVQIPEEGVGKSYYGCLITFQLNQQMYPNFEFSKAYYARYTWMDSSGSISDWNGFIFSSDVTDFTPIDVKKETILDPLQQQQFTDGITIDYLSGDVQKFTMTKDATFNVANALNIPYGKSLSFIISVYNSSKLTLEDQYNQVIYEQNGDYLVTVYNFGNQMMVSQKLLSQFVDKGQGTLQVYTTGYDDGKWSIDDGQTWKKSGDTLILQAGSYEITFYDPNPPEDIGEEVQSSDSSDQSDSSLQSNASASSDSSWDANKILAPNSVSISLSSGENQVVTGAYKKQGAKTGKLTLNFTDGFGQWSINNGTSWFTSGTTTQLQVGQVAIIFKSDQDYFSPDTMKVTIIEDETVTAQATYKKAGYLQVSLSQTNGKWSVDDGKTWNAHNAKLKLQLKEYTIKFQQLFGYQTPTSITKTPVHKSLTSVNVTYQQQKGETVSTDLTEYIYTSQPTSEFTIYVDTAMKGNGTGTSWDNATTLYNALNNLLQNMAYQLNSYGFYNNRKVKIYVKSGVHYMYSQWRPRNYTNVEIYGGFDQTGLWSNRQPLKNPSIIQGYGNYFLYNTYCLTNILIDGLKFTNFSRTIIYSYDYSYYSTNQNRYSYLYLYSYINGYQYYGCIRYFYYKPYNVLLSNCQFENNFSTSSYMLYGCQYRNCMIKNCTFAQGILYTYKNITDCLFINCYTNAYYYYSIYMFRFGGSSQTIKNTRFINCFIGNRVWYSSRPCLVYTSGCYIRSCDFVNCYCGSGAGTSYFFYGSLRMYDTRVLNCYTSSPHTSYFFYGSAYIYNSRFLNCASGTSWGGTKYFFRTTSYIYNSQFVNCGVYGTYMGYVRAYNCNIIKCVGNFYSSYLYNCFVYGTPNSFVYWNGCYFATNSFTGGVIAYGLNSYGFVPTYVISNNNYIPTFIAYFGDWKVVSTTSPLYVNGSWIGCYSNTGFITYSN